MALLPQDPRERWIDLGLWALAFLAAATTSYLSFGPSPPGANAFPGADKLMHATAYFVTVSFALLAGVWRPGRGEGPFARHAWVLLGGALAVGGGIELLQAMVGRDADVRDWVADLAGVGLAWLANRALKTWVPAAVVVEEPG